MIEFQIDKQTKNDLQIYSDQGASLLDCLNCTISNGGDFALRSMIDKPLIEELKIQERVDTIKFLINNVDHLAFDKTTIDFVEYSEVGDKYFFIIFLIALYLVNF